MKFSIAANPGIEVNDELIELIKTNSNIIHDIFITFKLKPFVRDAHCVLSPENVNRLHVFDMLELQEKSGVMISGTFNNILVPSDLDTLKVFVENLKPYYEKGLRKIIVPHSLWLYFGLLQENFPDMIFKTTVLKRCLTAQDFWNNAKAGYHEVVIDRSLVRNFKELSKIRRAQKLFHEKYDKYVKITINVMEGCKGDCPFWDDHYHHNLSWTGENINISQRDAMFKIPKSYSCLINNCPFKQMLIPIITEHLKYVFNHVDIVKLGGRGWQAPINTIHDNIYTSNMLLQSFNSETYFIKRVQHSPDALNKLKNDKVFNIWSNHIKNCKFHCWNCSLCDQLWTKYSSLDTYYIDNDPEERKDFEWDV